MMKDKLIVFSAVLISFLGYSQEHFLLPDSPAKCGKMREGRFLKVGTPEKIWYSVIKNNVQKDYANNGKDYIKYRLNFKDDCSYTATVTGKTDSRSLMRTGDIIHFTVLETDHQFLKIKSELYSNSEEFVLEKKD